MHKLADLLPPTAAAPLSPGAAPGDAAGILARALALAGLDAGEARALIIVGSDAALVEAALAACPGLAGFLVLDATSSAAAAALARRPRLRDTRGFAAGYLADAPPGLRSGDPAAAVACALELTRFFAAIDVPPSRAIVVAGADADAALAAAARDLCCGHSTRLLATVTSARIDPRPLRPLAEFLHAVGDRYHALKLHWFLHATRPEPALAWRVLEALSDLGCAETLAAWVQRPEFSAELRAEIGPVIAEERALQHEVRAALLARNLAALAQRAPAAAASLAAASAPAFDVVELPDVPWFCRPGPTGMQIERRPYPMIVRTDGACLVELNPPPDPATLPLEVAADVPASATHALVAGLARHAAAAQLLLSTRIVTVLPGWQRRVHLVEPDAGELRALLHVFDLSAVPFGEHVFLFAGPGAGRALVEFLAGDADHPVPRVRIGVDGALAAALERVEDERALRWRRECAALERRHDEARLRGLGAVLDDPHAPSRPLRIVLLTSLYTSVVQHVLADLALTITRLGHSCHVIKEAHPGQELHPATITSGLLAHAPDLVLMVNHTRAEMAGTLPAGLPVVTWIQDELPALKDPTRIARLGALDLTYAFGRDVAEIHRGLGYPHMGTLHFALAAGTELRPPPCGSPGDVCRDEIVYPAHLPALDEPRGAAGLAEWLEAEFAGRASIIVDMASLAPLLARACTELRLSAAPDSAELLYWTTMFVRRLERLRTADTLLSAGLPLSLYGRGWSDIPRFARHARGVVAPGAALAEIMRGHKVTMHSGYNLHPRVFAAYAAGGLPIGRLWPSDRLPGEAADQFVLGRELVLCGDDAELVGEIRRALTDEPWRRAVIAAGQARIAASHTYANRLDVILADLRAQLSRYLDQRAA